ncbi:unnamed protein product [Calypogeia fissa]
MGSQTDVVALEIIAKEKRNLSRRKFFYDKEQRERSWKLFLMEAEASSADLIQSAQIEANRISRKASEEASIILMDARNQAERDAQEAITAVMREASNIRTDQETELAELRKRTNELRQTIAEQEESLQRLNQERRPALSPAHDSRSKDAARKRREYRERRGRVLTTSIADDSPNANRKRRSVSHAVTMSVQHILATLKRFNDRAKEQFFKQLWQHRGLRPWQPTRFGSPKLDASDALGGHIKQGVEREQRKGTKGAKLECAHDVVSFCEEKFALGQAKEYGDVQFVRRFFWEIPVGAVNRNKKWDCDTIADDTPNECKNTLWTGRFKLHMVKGVLPADVRPDVDCMGVGEGVNAWEEGEFSPFGFY